MLEAKLVINGREFPIHYKLLREIAEDISDEEHYRPLARAILDLNIPSLSKELVRSIDFSQDELDSLWNQGDLDMRRCLARKDTFRKNLTDAQAQEIIKLDDYKILEIMANNAENFYPSEEKTQAMRLSGKMADALLEFIANHPDEGARRELAENRRAPAKFRPAIKEFIRRGRAISSSAVRWLTLDDLMDLEGASLKVWKTIANNIEDMKNLEARNKAADYLCSHPDPEVRLELAENWSAPRSVLARLADDEDLDVASAARKNMIED